MQTVQTPITPTPPTTSPTSHETREMSDLIRHALLAAGWTGFKLHRTTGLNETAMRAFLAGTQGLQLRSLDKIIRSCFPKGCGLSCGALPA